MRKATAFRGGANTTAPPCGALSENKYFPTVPLEQLERKTFLKVLLLEKTVFNVRQKGVPPLLLPASVQQLPRYLVRICNLFHKGNQIVNWQVSKNAIAAGKTDCKIEFASQMWAARPHLGSIFEKLLHRKTFQLPAARFLQQACN